MLWYKAFKKGPWSLIMTYPDGRKVVEVVGVRGELAASLGDLGFELVNGRWEMPLEQAWRIQGKIEELGVDTTAILLASDHVRREPAPVLAGCKLAQGREYPLSLELLCGASDVEEDHPGFFDPGDSTHPKHEEIKGLAEPLGMVVDITGSIQDGTSHSDAYVRFSPDQIEQLVGILRQVGFEGDILDIYIRLSPKDEKKVLQVAYREGWQVARHYASRTAWVLGHCKFASDYSSQAIRINMSCLTW